MEMSNESSSALEMEDYLVAERLQVFSKRNIVNVFNLLLLGRNLKIDSRSLRLTKKIV